MVYELCQAGGVTFIRKVTRKNGIITTEEFSSRLGSTVRKVWQLLLDRGDKSDKSQPEPEPEMNPKPAPDPEPALKLEPEPEPDPAPDLDAEPDPEPDLDLRPCSPVLDIPPANTPAVQGKPGLIRHLAGPLREAGPSRPCVTSPSRAPCVA
ncbi:hypothetical protein ABGB18_26365 [Nonomuraea sp. B12E4]|uniref:hypothetical protein n=1 Tax=Nonomuraea sp. B12E4 TaxID=3153564 RepID=UPI00325C887A